jgi:hypothetical protein
MAGLTAEQIQALLATSRTKGEYSQYLTQFLDSGEQGVCANDEWISLKDKKASTVKQGFANAIDKKDAHADAQFVKVLVNEDKVYLINLKAAGIADTTAVDEEPEQEAA